MLRFLGKIFLFILFFNYLYQINYSFSPLSTNVLLGIVGIIIYVVYPTVRREMVDGISVKNILYLFVPLEFISFFSIIVNTSTDFYFIKWGIINVLNFFGAMFLTYLIKKTWGYLNAHLIVKLMLFSALVQLTLALAMWINPTLYEFLFSVVHYDEIALRSMDRTEGHRLLGFGLSFFTSGVIHGLILILMSSFYEKKNSLKMFLWTLAFIYIAAVGMMMARTTIVGIIVAIILITLRTLQREITIKKYVSIFATICIIVFSFTTILYGFFEEFKTAIDFGFQMFISKQETGEVHVDSWAHMLEMYIFPSDLSTWIIGDAKWYDAGGYYMGTDIGFIRMIFYFGLLGLSLFLLYNIYMLKSLYKQNKELGIYLFIFLFFYVVTVNGKGFVDLFPYIIPLYFCERSFRNFKVD